MTTLTLKDLKTYRLVEPNLIENTDQWKNYSVKSKLIYSKLLKKYPKLVYREYQYKAAATYAARTLNVCGLFQGAGKTTIAGITIALTSDFTVEADRGSGRIHVIVPTILSASTRWLPDLQRIDDLSHLVELIDSEDKIGSSNKPIWVYQMDFLKRKSKDHPGLSLIDVINLNEKLPEFLIVDEAHHYKEKTKRTHTLTKIRSKADRVLFMSGTLSDGRLDLIHSVCSNTYLDQWPYTKRSLKSSFGASTLVDSTFLEGDKYSSLHNATPRYLNHLSVNKLPEWYALSKSKVHRVKLSDPEVKDCLIIPKAVYHFDEIQMTTRQETFYKSLVSKYKQDLLNVSKFSSSATNIASAFKVMQPLQRASNLPEDFFGVPNKAIKCLGLVLDAIDKNIKTVIFTDSNSVGHFLKNYLSDNLGKDHVNRIYAYDENETPKKMGESLREKVMSDFLYNPDVMVGIFSIRLTSESIDLTSAGQVIFYDLPWQSIKVQQAVARPVRPGSVHEEINIHFLVNKGTTDIHRSNLLKQKVVGSSLLLDFDVVNTGAESNPIDEIKTLF